MAKTQGPRIPKAGWMKRWIVSAIKLSLATPALLAVSGLGAMLNGLVSAAIAASLFGATKSAPLAFFAADFSGSMISAASMLAGFILLRHADGRDVPDLGLLLARLKSIGPYIVLSLAAFSLIGCLGRDAEWFSDLMEIHASPLGTYSLGSIEMAEALFDSSAVLLFALPSLVLTNCTLPSLRQASDMLTNRAFTIFLSVLMSMLLLPMLAMPYVQGLQLLALSFTMAWGYVVAREVIDGDDENGIRAESRVFRTAPSPV